MIALPEMAAPCKAAPHVRLVDHRAESDLISLRVRNLPGHTGIGRPRMKCPRCQHENPAGQEFCGECGARLTAVCPSCGASNPPGQKFCGECGASLSQGAAAGKFASPGTYTPQHLAEKILTSKNALEGERKQVTVLFADLKGSME